MMVLRYVYSPQKISSVAIGFLVLMLHSISIKLGYMNITRMVPNINIFRYIIPPLIESISVFLVYNLNRVSLKFTGPFKDTIVSRIIIGNNGGFQLIGDQPKFHKFILIIFHIIQERFISYVFIENVSRFSTNVWN